MAIRVEQGKARKDRCAMLSEPLLHLLRAWWLAARERGRDSVRKPLSSIQAIEPGRVAVNDLLRVFGREPGEGAPDDLLGVGE